MKLLIKFESWFMFETMKVFEKNCNVDKFPEQSEKHFINLCTYATRGPSNFFFDFSSVQKFIKVLMIVKKKS